MATCIVAELALPMVRPAARRARNTQRVSGTSRRPPRRSAAGPATVTRPLKPISRSLELLPFPAMLPRDFIGGNLTVAVRVVPGYGLSSPRAFLQCLRRQQTVHVDRAQAGTAAAATSRAPGRPAGRDWAETRNRRPRHQRGGRSPGGSRIGQKLFPAQVEGQPSRQFPRCRCTTGVNVEGRSAAAEPFADART